MNRLLRALGSAWLLATSVALQAAAPVPDAESAAAVERLIAEPAAQRLWTTAQGRVTPAADAVIHALEAARERGLDPADYDAAGLRQRAASAPSTPAEAERLDHALTRSLVRFIVHLERGRVRPQDAGYALAPRRPPTDLVAAIRALAGGANVAAVLDAQEPRYRHFALLKQALHRYQALAAAGPDLRLPKLLTRSLKPGDPYADAALLRQRLVQLGDLDAAARTSDGLLDEGLAAALARFQARHGLGGDGVLGAATWRELNVPIARRVRQIELSMERVRWLPPPPEAPFIVVNIPQFRLYAFRGPADAEQAMTAMNVIVGRTFPRFRTPVFAAELRQVVFRPYWDVPANILRNEVLPELRRDSRIAEREGYEAVRGQRDDSPVVPLTPAALEALAAGQLRLRQRPGPKNALGGVKFLLPNPYDVYLHSTPAQRLFRQPRRAFSHGCVRVEDPVALARFVFADDPMWDETRIRASMQEGAPSERIRLPRTIPVMIFYATAAAAEDGRVLFLDDLYRHDRRLEALLASRR